MKPTCSSAISQEGGKHTGPVPKDSKEKMRSGQEREKGNGTEGPKDSEKGTSGGKWDTEKKGERETK